jgi:hypothetical protein
LSAARRVELVNDRMSYIILRGQWCYTIVLNVHAPFEDNNDDIKDSIYEEVWHIFYQFPRYGMKIFWVISVQK